MRTEISRRKADKKYTLWGWMPDPSFEVESEKAIPFISMRWVPLGVHGSFREAHEQQKTIR